MTSRAGIYSFKFRLDILSGCWNWIGSKNRDGYGQIRVERSGFNGYFRAHRVSWIYHHGEIPDGLCVLHRCDNPGCVNPEHLFLGTQADNMRDRNAKGRLPHEKLRGSSNGRALLNEADVAEIRRLSADGARQADIARRFGIAKATVYCILRGLTWRHAA